VGEILKSQVTARLSKENGCGADFREILLVVVLVDVADVGGNSQGKGQNAFHHRDRLVFAGACACASACAYAGACVCVCVFVCVCVHG